MKVVLWDWNGTLLNDASILWQIFNEVVQSYGHSPVSFERYQEIYRHPAHLMYEDAGVDLLTHSFEAVARRWHDVYRVRVESAALHHDALIALESFKGLGSRQMVLSALSETLLKEVVVSHGINGFFEQVRGLSDLFAHSKVGVGKLLLEELGVAGADVLMIGDSSHDAEVAQAIGSQCCLVARGSESRSRLEQNGYSVFDSLQEMLAEVLG